MAGFMVGEMLQKHLFLCLLHVFCNMHTAGQKFGKRECKVRMKARFWDKSFWKQSFIILRGFPKTI